MSLLLNYHNPYLTPKYNTGFIDSVGRSGIAAIQRGASGILVGHAGLASRRSQYRDEYSDPISEEDFKSLDLPQQWNEKMTVGDAAALYATKQNADFDSFALFHNGLNASAGRSFFMGASSFSLSMMDPINWIPFAGFTTRAATVARAAMASASMRQAMKGIPRAAAERTLMRKFQQQSLRHNVKEGLRAGAISFAITEPIMYSGNQLGFQYGIEQSAMNLSLSLGLGAGFGAAATYFPKFAQKFDGTMKAMAAFNLAINAGNPWAWGQAAAYAAAHAGIYTAYHFPRSISYRRMVEKWFGGPTLRVYDAGRSEDDIDIDFKTTVNDVPKALPEWAKGAKTDKTYHDIQGIKDAKVALNRDIEENGLTPVNRAAMEEIERMEAEATNEEYVISPSLRQVKAAKLSILRTINRLGNNVDRAKAIIEIEKIESDLTKIELARRKILKAISELGDTPDRRLALSELDRMESTILDKKHTPTDYDAVISGSYRMANQLAEESFASKPPEQQAQEINNNLLRLTMDDSDRQLVDHEYLATIIDIIDATNIMDKAISDSTFILDGILNSPELRIPSKDPAIFARQLEFITQAAKRLNDTRTVVREDDPLDPVREQMDQQLATIGKGSSFFQEVKPKDSTRKSKWEKHGIRKFRKKYVDEDGNELTYIAEFRNGSLKKVLIDTGEPGMPPIHDDVLSSAGNITIKNFEERFDEILARSDIKPAVDITARELPYNKKKANTPKEGFFQTASQDIPHSYGLQEIIVLPDTPNAMAYDSLFNAPAIHSKPPIGPYASDYTNLKYTNFPFIDPSQSVIPQKNDYILAKKSGHIMVESSLIPTINTVPDNNNKSKQRGVGVGDLVVIGDPDNYTVVRISGVEEVTSGADVITDFGAIMREYDFFSYPQLEKQFDEAVEARFSQKEENRRQNKGLKRFPDTPKRVADAVIKTPVSMDIGENVMNIVIVNKTDKYPARTLGDLVHNRQVGFGPNTLKEMVRDFFKTEPLRKITRKEAVKIDNKPIGEDENGKPNDPNELIYRQDSLDRIKEFFKALGILRELYTLPQRPGEKGRSKQVHRLSSPDLFHVESSEYHEKSRKKVFTHGNVIAKSGIDNLIRDAKIAIWDFRDNPIMLDEAMPFDRDIIPERADTDDVDPEGVYRQTDWESGAEAQTPEQLFISRLKEAFRTESANVEYDPKGRHIYSEVNEGDYNYMDNRIHAIENLNDLLDIISLTEKRINKAWADSRNKGDNITKRRKDLAAQFAVELEIIQQAMTMLDEDVSFRESAVTKVGESHFISKRNYQKTDELQFGIEKIVDKDTSEVFYRIAHSPDRTVIEDIAKKVGVTPESLMKNFPYRRRMKIFSYDKVPDLSKAERISKESFRNRNNFNKLVKDPKWASGLETISLAMSQADSMIIFEDHPFASKARSLAEKQGMVEGKHFFSITNDNGNYLDPDNQVVKALKKLRGGEQKNILNRPLFVGNIKADDSIIRHVFDTTLDLAKQYHDGSMIKAKADDFVRQAEEKKHKENIETQNNRITGVISEESVKQIEADNAKISNTGADSNFTPTPPGANPWTVARPEPRPSSVAFPWSDIRSNEATAVIMEQFFQHNDTLRKNGSLNVEVTTHTRKVQPKKGGDRPDELASKEEDFIEVKVNIGEHLTSLAPDVMKRIGNQIRSLTWAFMVKTNSADFKKNWFKHLKHLQPYQRRMLLIDPNREDAMDQLEILFQLDKVTDEVYEKWKDNFEALSARSDNFFYSQVRGLQAVLNGYNDYIKVYNSLGNHEAAYFAMLEKFSKDIHSYRDQYRGELYSELEKHKLLDQWLNLTNEEAAEVFVKVAELEDESMVAKDYDPSDRLTAIANILKNNEVKRLNTHNSNNDNVQWKKGWVARMKYDPNLLMEGGKSAYQERLGEASWLGRFKIEQKAAYGGRTASLDPASAKENWVNHFTTRDDVTLDYINMFGLLDVKAGNKAIKNNEIAEVKVNPNHWFTKEYFPDLTERNGNFFVTSGEINRAAGEFLAGVFDKITEGGENLGLDDYFAINTSKLATRILYDDPLSRYNTMAEWSHDTLSQNVLAHIHDMGKWTAITSNYGVHPDFISYTEWVEGFFAPIIELAKKDKGKTVDSMYFARSIYRGLGGDYKGFLREITEANMVPENSTVAMVGDIGKQIMLMANLGMSAIQAMADTGSVDFRLNDLFGKANNYNLIDQIKAFIKPNPEWAKNRLAALGLTLQHTNEMMLKVLGQEGLPISPMHKATHKIITLTGLEKVTRKMREGFALMTADNFGQVADKKFDELEPEMQEGLARYDITPVEWDFIRDNVEVLDWNGREVKMITTLGNLDSPILTAIARRRGVWEGKAMKRKIASDIAHKWQRLLRTEMDRAVIMPDSFESALLKRGTQRGTIANALLDNLALFKHLPVAFLRKQLGPAAGDAYKGRPGSRMRLLHMIGIMVAIGYLITIIKDILSNREPRLWGRSAFMASLQNSGAFGIYSALLAEEWDIQSDAGMADKFINFVGGVPKAKLDKFYRAFQSEDAGEFAARFGGAVGANIPLQNWAPLKAAIDLIITQPVNNLLNPEYMDRKDQFLEEHGSGIGVRIGE